MSTLRPKIQQKLDGMVARLHELLAQSSDPKLLERPERLAALQKELGQTAPVVERYRSWQQLQQQIGGGFDAPAPAHLLLGAGRGQLQVEQTGQETGALARRRVVAQQGQHPVAPRRR